MGGANLRGSSGWLSKKQAIVRCGHQNFSENVSAELGGMFV